MVALAIGAMLTLLAVPAFRYMIESSRLKAASRQAVGDLRETRAQAIATGWECRIVGYGATSTHPNRNQYRRMARRTTGTPWPSDTSPSFRNTTERVEPWVDVSSMFPGIQLDPGGASPQDRFEVVFDSRGAAFTSTNDFTPFQVVRGAKTTAITISAAGGISLQ